MLKIAELAERSGVSIATLKHYLREGLIAPAKKTGRTMSYYDEPTVARVRVIKELQQRQFLPLDLIKRTLAADSAPDELAAASAIAGVLAKHRGTQALTRAELLSRGADERELDWLAAAQLAVPTDGAYRGDDLAILQTLGAARKAGISPAMLPFEILRDYLAALRRLVEIELQMFRAGVLARAEGVELPALTTAATELSERLVVLLRRKLLLPTLHRIVEEERHEPDHRHVGTGRVRVAKPRRPPGHRPRRSTARRG
ncbi:MAG: MerR family transcriptional regulator [Kofleriaceae bacterium]